MIQKESKIGLITDVGSGYFLSRLKKHIGYFLAITAKHIKGQELVQVGVADHFVRRDNIAKLEQEIIQNTNPDSTVDDLRDIVKKYEEPVDNKYPNEDLIDELFGKESLEDIYNAIRECKVNKEFTENILVTLEKMCPLSLKVGFQQLKRGRELDLRENLRMDRRIVMRFLVGHDTREGIRCTLIDKGDQPKWSHKSLFDVTEKEVEEYFEKLESHREILQ